MLFSLEEIRDKAQLVIDETEKDAAALDSTPFTARDVAEAFGNVLAGVDALARLVKDLAWHMEES